MERQSASQAGGAAEPPAAVKEEELWAEHVETILNRLQQIYASRIAPVEQAYEYDMFKPSWFSETIKQKKPFVTFLGPFSSGKSTFINYLMQTEYLLTGPQPVTDKFSVIMYGERAQAVPGRVLLADSSLPFRGLNQFGDSFAEVFSGLLAPHPILKSVSFVDTPGVLEAAGDIHERKYDYVKVVRWFVEKSDLVFFLFDPTKLDAGAELRAVFTQALKGFEGKIRMVLNKADTVKPQELLRVYGALFWNLSNLISSTEPPRVYVSSFWQREYQPGTNHELFSREKDDLLYELIETVPLQSLDRRVTSVIRRATDVLMWALLCATYRTRIPAVFGKDRAKANFYAQYPQIVQDLASKYHLSEKDFPTCAVVKAYLTRVASHKYPDMEKLRKKGWVDTLRQSIDKDLPTLLGPIKQHAVIDPRDRRRAIAVLRAYNLQRASQAHVREEAAAAQRQQLTIVTDAEPVATSAPPTPAASSGFTPEQQQQMFAMMQALMAQQPQPPQSPQGRDYRASASGGEAPDAQGEMPRTVAPASRTQQQSAMMSAWLQTTTAPQAGGQAMHGSGGGGKRL